MNDNVKSAFNLAAADGVIDPAHEKIIGLDIGYDMVDGVIKLTPDPAFRRRQSLNARAPELAEGETVVLPAVFSGFANLRGGMDYMVDQPMGDNRQPLLLDVDSALQYKGTVLEARADYNENDKDPWARRETRLVRDWPDQMVRGAAGDLSYPVSGFQSYQPMLGVSVARNFSLQPYRVTTPTGDASFVVRTPSRVEIEVNGRTVRSFRLEPGTYNIRDFPVADGSNDVTLVITDATGNTERRSFPLLSDRQLLEKGLHAYAYNFGVESETNARRIDYNEKRPALSFFHNYGLTETMTTGIGMQGDKDVQQATGIILKAFDIGTFGLELAASRLESRGTGQAARLSFSHDDNKTGRSFSVETAYRSVYFAGLGQRTTGPLQPASVETIARYTQDMGQGLNAGIGGRYRMNDGGAADDWSYGVNVGKSFMNGISLSLSAENRSRDGAGVFAGLTWSPPLSRHTVMTAVDTLAGTQSVEWDYRAEHDTHSFRGGAGVTRSDGGRAETTGEIGYTGYRGEVLLRHDVIAAGPTAMEAKSRSTLQGGTALVFADGNFGLSRPVNGSFVLLHKHKSLQSSDIGINPAGSSAADAIAAAPSYQAEIDGWGAAVLPDAVPYMYRSVRVDTRNMPLNYDIGRDSYTVFPAYKAGSVIMVGQDATVYADGVLHYADGSPAVLEGGELVNQKDAEVAPVPFFTNSEGRFRVSRLKPGDYKVVLLRRPDTTGHVHIADDGRTTAKLGTVIMTQAVLSARESEL